MKSKNSSKKDIETKKASALRENIEAILVAIVLALFIRTFMVQAFKIPSASMEQTLQIGDHILVNKFIYGVGIPFLNTPIFSLKKPEREDIIVFKYPMNPKKDYIKRVIGVEGDRIEIRNKQIYINNERLEKKSYENHTDPRIIPGRIQPRDNFGPVIVPHDSLFVMGDNRENSSDSRFWGFVNLKAIKGKAFIIYWSWDSNNFGVRWNRLGHLLK